MNNNLLKSFAMLLIVVIFTSCGNTSKALLRPLPFLGSGLTVTFDLATLNFSYEEAEYQYVGELISSNDNQEYKEWFYFTTKLKAQTGGLEVENVKIVKTNQTDKLELLEEDIKLIYEDEEYIILKHPIKKDNLIEIDKLELRGPFDLYIGKVKVNDKEIVEVPPLRFKRYIHVKKFLAVSDFFENPKFETVYYGPLEDFDGEIDERRKR